MSVSTLIFLVKNGKTQCSQSDFLFSERIRREIETVPISNSLSLRTFSVHLTDNVTRYVIS